MASRQKHQEPIQNFPNPLDVRNVGCTARGSAPAPDAVKKGRGRQDIRNEGTDQESCAVPTQRMGREKDITVELFFFF